MTIPRAIGRFDWTTLGFHGYIETDHGLVYIDPYQKSDTQNYLVYYKHEFGKTGNEFYCKVEQNIAKIIKSKYETSAPDVPQFSFGGSVRTYRIAIATTGEWSRNAAGYIRNA